MKARLAKDGVRVLCRVIDCGAVLGAVYTDGYTQSEFVSANTGWIHVAAAGPREFVVLRPGYRSDPNGTFRITVAAAERRRYGAPMRVGGRMPSDRPHDPAKPTEAGVVPCCLPRPVACFACGMVQELDPVGLHVEGRSHSLRVNRSGMGGKVERINWGSQHADHPHYWHTKFWRARR